MRSDIEIAQEARLLHINEVGKKLGLQEEDLYLCGPYKAKINLHVIDKFHANPEGRLILVTGMTPTPYGEGKTTVAIGLSDALNRLGKKATVTLREPSLGPVFGIKGGAAGGGYAQVVPMEDINLHFTGDFHAVAISHNLLSAIIDNHIYHRNQLGIDTRRITWRRVIDLNDRALRDIVVGLGGASNGFPREDGFDITAASEIMAILGLSMNYDDLKKRLSNIVIGYNLDKKPVRVKDLEVEGALAALLRDAIKPNLVQTLENNPAIIHTGPFANIAHGTNSLLAIKIALKLSDYVITEAGFGSDLGGEKFLDIVSDIGVLKPQVAVIVASIRALKHHGGIKKDKLGEENLEAVKRGLDNLRKHIENMELFNLPYIVALNKFPQDTEREVEAVVNTLEKEDRKVSVVEVWAKGGEGGEDLARKIIDLTSSGRVQYVPLYKKEEEPEAKITRIAQLVYGAKNVIFEKTAKQDLKRLQKYGFGDLYICMAKTQLSLSGNPRLIGRPKDFDLHIREIRLSAGAGFIVPIAGDIMTMPGLPKEPQAKFIDIDSKGKIKGLF